MKKALLLLSLLIAASMTFAQSTSVRVNAYLQGAYSGSGNMSTLINASGYLPLSQPYDTLPWNYSGMEQLNQVPANMVDWVLLELRDAQNNSMGHRAALLLSDGSILDTNLSADIAFNGVSPGDYYLIVDHRNHLPVMSGQAIATPATVAWDFSDTLNYPSLGGALAQKELESGVFGLIAGDVNKDGIIKYSGAGNDRAMIIQRIIGQTGSTSITATAAGYFKEDLSMDGVVKYAGAGNDPAQIIQTLIGMTGSTSITTTYSTPALVPPAPAPSFTCSDSLVDSRDGQSYATVQIGTQCWMAENLNVGRFLQSVYQNNNNHSDLSDNDTIEKYCYNNIQANCDGYGGLYDWTEAMNYQNVEGGQGICPEGWHLPSDAEWKLLEGNVDSLFSPNDSEWDNTGWRGFNAGGKLKEAGTQHWLAPNIDASGNAGFLALPGGHRAVFGDFSTLSEYAYFWSSSSSSSYVGGFRSLASSSKQIRKADEYRTFGFSIRCIWDSIIVCSPQPDQANAGTDSLGIVGDSVQLWANQSAVGSQQWAVITSTGSVTGSFSDSTAADSWFYGAAGDTFELVWTISTQCGSSSDTIIIGFAAQPTSFSCGDTLVDSRDGQSYATVQIGTQCWMAENLNVGTLVNSYSNQSNNSTPEKYCYNNDANNCAVYGGLYQWDEAMDYSTTVGGQGICPTGWHLPGDGEWCTLLTYLDASVNCNTYGYSGTSAGGKLKETGTSHWNSPNTGATNSSGFTAFGAGSKNRLSFFGNLKQACRIWTSSEDSGEGISWQMYWDDANILKHSDDKTYGLSVRCLRNN